MNVIGYCRVSTREQGESGLGLDAQRFALEQEAARRGWTLTVVTEVGSGKDLDRRPVLCEALASLKRHEADALAVAKLDRVSRSLVDFARVIARAKAERWNVIALDLGVDTSTPSGELVANVLMSIAQWERRTIGERTRVALAAAKRQGKRLGTPSHLDRSAIAYAVQMRRAGLSLRAIAETLTNEGYRTAGGYARWHETTVARALRTHHLDQEAEAARTSA